MAAFFAWGNTPNSFVVGNGSLLDYQNLPEEYAGKFKSYEWNAMTLRAFYTGPQGFHWALQPGNAWSAVAPTTLLPFLKTQHVVDRPSEGTPRGSCQYVAFTPKGSAWFARYSNKTCLWGPPDALPSTFLNVVADLEAHHPRKDECIDFAVFGAHELLLLRFENGNSGMFLPDDPNLRRRISPDLVVEVEDRLKDGWTLGNRTALCHFDSARWFIEWKRGASAEFKYSAGEGDAASEDLKRISKVLSGVGNNATLVADHQAADLAAANAAFQGQIMINRILTR
ncbi:hypothetical protein HGRIS_003057 [Hohenbuehelia grisea]|uniref:Uncharacterized protein n=1 Tax=Hohenbuehelia grisea TaxID=104357 RepID=A0ABR3JMK9_9AGAR